MSQPHNLTDTQGLLQSMLQRLKLQPGREGQSIPSSPVTTSAATWNQDEDKGQRNPEKLHHVNGFEPKTNGISPKQFGITAVESNFGSKGGDIQQPIQSHDMDRTNFSSPAVKNNIDYAASGKKVLGEAAQPEISLGGTGESLPARSLKDHDISPLKKTDGEKFKLSSPAMLRQTAGDKYTVTISGQQQEQSEDFTARVYAWSPKPRHSNVDTRGLDNKTSYVENGGFGDFGQSKDMLFVASSQTATHNNLKRAQRSSDNKKRRWTQKIKEKWLDRSGSKRGKDQGGGADHKAEHGTETTEGVNASRRESEATSASLDSSDLSETLTVISEEDPSEDRTRSSGDFDFGLGSFSLLEEIVTGQEWAKFLNPSVTATSTNQKQPEEPLSQLQSRPNSHHSGQSSLMLSQQAGGHSFTGTGSTSGPYFVSTHMSPDAFQLVSMEVSEGKGRQQQEVHRAADQSEPMEEVQTAESGRRQQHRPPSFTEPAGNVIHSVLKNVHQNRKRQHQSAARDEALRSEITGAALSSAYSRDVTNETQRDVDMSSSSPTTSLTPSFRPFAYPSRSVLKHTESLDWSSMETETKRRRVEENRRVHFAEEVVTIDPPEFDMDATESEEEEEEEDNSVNDHDSGQLATQVTSASASGAAAATAAAAAATRRPGFPAWIQALKMRNSGRRRSYRL